MIGGIGGISPSSLTGNFDGTGPMAPTIGGEPAGSFATLLSRAAGDVVDRLQTAEQVSVTAMQGKADVREVVDAVMSAEQSLQAAIAVRDKIVTAYLEVSRMAI
jgi:flagellar hook-basal body complex protein FliE